MTPSKTVKICILFLFLIRYSILITRVNKKGPLIAKMNEFSIVTKGRGKVMLYNGYEYVKKKVYKSGGVWWRCCQQLKKKCTGSVTIEVRQLNTIE